MKKELDRFQNPKASETEKASEEEKGATGNSRR